MINTTPVKDMEEDIQLETVDTVDNLELDKKYLGGTTDRTEETNTISHESHGKNILKKCIRRGDKICYSKVENINMLHNAKKDAYNRKSSFDATHQPDKVMSGESLYKEFTFRQGSNDEETEKCMAFWKSVMEKNLDPVKCTIMGETTKSEVASEVDEIREPASDLDEEKPAPDLDEEKLKSEMARIHDQYKTMWMNLLNELQKKRLHEIKLIGKSRCKICDSPLEEELHTVSKSEIKKEIEQLNYWTPKRNSDRPSYSRERRSLRQGSINKKPDITYAEKRISQPKQLEVPVAAGAPVTAVLPEVLEAPTKTPVSPPKPDKNTYKHIDVIGDKKKSGAYTEWRTNKVKAPCPCGYPDCDCNINPAIVFVETPSDSKFKATKEVKLEKARSHSGIDTQISRTHIQDRRVRRRLSVMIKCTCSSSECDCQAHAQILEKIALPPGTDIELPKPKVERRRKSLTLVSSLELLGKKLKPKDKLHIVDRVAKKRNSGTFHDGKHDPDKHISQTTKKQIEDMPQKCTCGNKDCDCIKVEESKTQEIKTQEIKTQEIKTQKAKDLKECLCTYPCDCKGAKVNPFKADDSLEDYGSESPKRNGDVEVQLKVVEL